MKNTLCKASVVMSVALAVAACGEAGTEVDTDSDGLTDQLESALETDPNNADSDADLVTDGREYENGTNPFTNDSDADGVWDGDEDEDANGIFERHERHRRVHRFADHKPGKGFGFGRGHHPDADGGFGDFGDAAPPWGTAFPGQGERDCDAGAFGEFGQHPGSGDGVGAPVPSGPLGDEPTGGGWVPADRSDAGSW